MQNFNPDLVSILLILLWSALALYFLWRARNRTEEIRRSQISQKTVEDTPTSPSNAATSNSTNNSPSQSSPQPDYESSLDQSVALILLTSLILVILLLAVAWISANLLPLFLIVVPPLSLLIALAMVPRGGRTNPAIGVIISLIVTFIFLIVLSAMVQGNFVPTPTPASVVNIPPSLTPNLTTPPPVVINNNTTVIISSNLGTAAPVTTPRPADVAEAYNSAIIDAATIEPNEIFTNLTIITTLAPNMMWYKNRLLVLAYSNFPKYSSQVGTEITNGSPDGLWVSIVPELQNFCHRRVQLQGDELDLRVQQLLGLPPRSFLRTPVPPTPTYPWNFVELWVNPNDLFRPSPDPEITDGSAELSFPQKYAVQISAAYETWYNGQLAKKYGTFESGWLTQTAVPYPWTRLGYTYDWGNPDSDVGLSEYVLVKDAPAYVAAVVPDARAYCDGGFDRKYPS